MSSSHFTNHSPRDGASSDASTRTGYGVRFSVTSPPHRAVLFVRGVRSVAAREPVVKAGGPACTGVKERRKGDGENGSPCLVIRVVIRGTQRNAVSRPNPPPTGSRTAARCPARNRRARTGGRDV